MTLQEYNRRVNEIIDEAIRQHGGNRSDYLFYARQMVSSEIRKGKEGDLYKVSWNNFIDSLSYMFRTRLEDNYEGELREMLEERYDEWERSTNALDNVQRGNGGFVLEQHDRFNDNFTRVVQKYIFSYEDIHSNACKMNIQECYRLLSQIDFRMAIAFRNLVSLIDAAAYESSDFDEWKPNKKE